MRNQRLNIILAAALGSTGLASVGCTADVHDNTADVHDNKADVDTNVDVDAELNFDVDSNVDVDKVVPGDSVAVTMNATGVVLVDPGSDPSEEDAPKAAHFEIYLDSTDGEPITVTAQASASVTIPKDTKEGDHKLICQLRKHDGSSIMTREISIKVAASASVGVAGASGTMM
jgi:hypothetical protein